MISIWRNSDLKIRRRSTTGMPIYTLAEAKACNYTVGYGFMRAATVSTSGTVPIMQNFYARDQQCWNMIWPGSYDWGDSPQQVNYIADESFHSHGYGSYGSESMMLLSHMFRKFSLPSGIMNPPLSCRMWLQNCGCGIYHYRPSLPQTWYGAGVVGANWPSGNYGLQLAFWSETGTGSCTYIITHQEIYDANMAAGNSLSVQNGCWPMWSGGIMTRKLTNVPPLFNQGNGVVCCTLRWVWPSMEPISPICQYCSGIDQVYSSPATRIKYASNPMLYVWG